MDFVGLEFVVINIDDFCDRLTAYRFALHFNYAVLVEHFIILAIDVIELENSSPVECILLSDNYSWHLTNLSQIDGGLNESFCTETLPIISLFLIVPVVIAVWTGSAYNIDRLCNLNNMIIK